MAELPAIAPDGVQDNETGTVPNVSPSGKDSTRAISSVSQAFSVMERMVDDWKDGIKNAARVTAKLNGQRPYSQTKLNSAGKGWKTNISTGFLSTECARVLPRLFMPIKTAKYLTSSTLPTGWPNGLSKTEIYREVLTEKIRAWPKQNFYLRGMAREVGHFGFAFNVFFDEYDPYPTLMRMDKGFIPKGTEVLEEPEFFGCHYDYKPSELVKLVKEAKDADRSEWNVGNVVAAINKAAPRVASDGDESHARTYEELIRQATTGFNYTKGVNVIQTFHLFAKETSGKVSHYVLLLDEAGTTHQGEGRESRLLYENLDQFDRMSDAVSPVVFDYGDGTVHGSWGAGQILYDLAAQVEKIRCDAMDNLRNTNKLKAHVPEGKNVNDVKLMVQDTMMILAGATLAGNVAGIGQDIEGFELLDSKLSQVAQQKIGAFVPPIPLQPSDIKATQINAELKKEQELQESNLENWLIQHAYLTKNQERRFTNSGSPHEDAKEVIKTLKDQGLTDEEIGLFRDSPVKSIMEFTEYRTQQKAMFSAQVIGNPLFNQTVVARTMAAVAGDSRFIEEICIKDGDQTTQLAAQRQQLIENAAMALGQPVPVLPQDLDWVHMETLKEGLMQAVESGNAQLAEIALNHYAAHYQQGVGKNEVPKDRINDEKSLISAVEKRINVLKEGQAVQAQVQQAEQAATAQAQQIVQQEQAGGMEMGGQQPAPGPMV